MRATAGMVVPTRGQTRARTAPQGAREVTAGGSSSSEATVHSGECATTPSSPIRRVTGATEATDRPGVSAAPQETPEMGAGWPQCGREEPFLSSSTTTRSSPTAGDRPAVRVIPVVRTEICLRVAESGRRPEGSLRPPGSIWPTPSSSSTTPAARPMSAIFFPRAKISSRAIRYYGPLPTTGARPRRWRRMWEVLRSTGAVPRRIPWRSTSVAGLDPSTENPTSVPWRRNSSPTLDAGGWPFRRRTSSTISTIRSG